MAWWGWVLLSPVIIFVLFKVTIYIYVRFFLLKGLSKLDESDFEDGPDPVSDLMETVLDGSVTQEAVDALAELPEHRHVLYFELAFEDRADLIPDRYDGDEDQAIASLARHFYMDVGEDSIPSKFTVLHSLRDPEDNLSFHMIEFDDPRRDGARGVGLVGPVKDRLPYRAPSHAFAREGDTAETVTGPELIAVWRDELAEPTGGMTYRYPDDPPKRRDMA